MERASLGLVAVTVSIMAPSAWGACSGNDCEKTIDKLTKCIEFDLSRELLVEICKHGADDGPMKYVLDCVRKSKDCEAFHECRKGEATQRLEKWKSANKTGHSRKSTDPDAAKKLKAELQGHWRAPGFAEFQISGDKVVFCELDEGTECAGDKAEGRLVVYGGEAFDVDSDSLIVPSLYVWRHKGKLLVSDQEPFLVKDRSRFTLAKRVKYTSDPISRLAKSGESCKFTNPADDVSDVTCGFEKSESGERFVFGYGAVTFVYHVFEAKDGFLLVPDAMMSSVMERLD